MSDFSTHLILWKGLEPTGLSSWGCREDQKWCPTRNCYRNEILDNLMALRLEKPVKRETASLVHEFSPESHGMSGTWLVHSAFSWRERRNPKAVSVPFPVVVPQTLASSLLEYFRNSSTDEAGLHGFMRVKKWLDRKRLLGPVLLKKSLWVHKKATNMMGWGTRRSYTD